MCYQICFPMFGFHIRRAWKVFLCRSCCFVIPFSWVFRGYGWESSWWNDKSRSQWLPNWLTDEPPLNKKPCETDQKFFLYKFEVDKSALLQLCPLFRPGKQNWKFVKGSGHFNTTQFSSCHHFGFCHRDLPQMIGCVYCIFQKQDPCDVVNIVTKL